MNAPSEISKRSAVLNALSSISKDKLFPKKVLVGHWEDYLFFEPILLFGPCFIDIKNLLLSAEDASVIAMINLGTNIPINYNDPPVLFIDKKTKTKEYIYQLETKGSPVGWRFLMDRYVCTSDKGKWSIYCEKENDVGVFAFRSELLKSTCLQVEKLLKAKSIRFASSAGDAQLFDFEKLLPDWRSILVAEHS